MRHLRPIATLLALGAIIAACASPAGTSGGEATQGTDASEPAPTAAGGDGDSGGGGGSGGGANGSMTYEITGDYEASGELPFLAAGISLWVEEAGGWVASFANPSGEGAYIQLNTQAAEGTTGQIWNYGDGTVIIGAVSGSDTGMGCTFTLTKNDPSGLEGDLDCTSAIVTNAETGENGTVQITAHWEGHP